MPATKPRQRATWSDINKLHDAQRIVGPYQAQLAEWNRKFALLRALHTKGLESSVTSQATETAHKITELRSHFRADVTHAGGVVEKHSVVRDIDRAMLRLATEFEGLANRRTT